MNSAMLGERQLGVMYYWTPEYAQDLYKKALDEGLKGSGNYGVFGIGVYNGQGVSKAEANNNMHMVMRLSSPWKMPGGQIMEAGVQAYTGRYSSYSGRSSPRAAPSRQSSIRQTASSTSGSGPRSSTTRSRSDSSPNGTRATARSSAR